MKVKRHLTCAILLIIATIIMSTVCAGKKGKLSKAKNAIGKLYSKNKKSLENWQASITRHVPIVKEDDINNLLYILSYEADLIKIGAFRKLNKMFNSITKKDEKHILILAKLQATVELVKLYGSTWNYPMTKATFHHGLIYAKSCETFNPKKECLIKKLHLHVAYILSHNKFQVNRLTRRSLSKTFKEAEQHIPADDRSLKFINIKFSCEIQLAQDYKSSSIKNLMILYMGRHKNYDCVEELQPFENHLEEIDSYLGEYHYLLARAYGYNKNYKLALDHLRIARKAAVLDSKTRYTNKKVQAYYEKVYMRNNAIVK